MCVVFCVVVSVRREEGGKSHVGGRNVERERAWGEDRFVPRRRRNKDMMMIDVHGNCRLHHSCIFCVVREDRDRYISNIPILVW